MAIEVIMPQMGESIAEGTITRWLVQPGERVERDQPLFEISTDKVDAEIPSPAAGVLLEIRRNEGETVPVDELVALIGEESEQPSDVPAATPAETAPAAETSGDTSGAVVMKVADEKLDLDDRLRRFSSPVVRKMAAESGIDLAEVEGTGIHGRVTKRDLEAFLASGAESASRPAAATEVPESAPPTSRPPAVKTAEVVPTPSRQAGEFFVPAFTESENVEIEPMSNIRRITAAHMVYSKATSAHVTTVFEMDLSRVARARQQAKNGFLKAHGTKLTYMPFLFKAVANGLVANPKLNAAIDGTNVVFKKDINIGMAVALDWGLLVPVIRNADQMNLVGLAKSANDLADRARTKKLSPDEVQGGTFTVTNPGVFGSLFGTPIINQPQVAILGVGVIEKRPVVVSDTEGNDTIAIKTMSYLAITYDHRLVDGADADHFMIDVKRTLAEESWSELDSFRK